MSKELISRPEVQMARLFLDQTALATMLNNLRKN